MSMVEDPVETVIRLLSKNLRVVKENGALASVYVSREWYDRELFKNHDGQVTVGLAESLDSKVELSGKIRRRLVTLRVNVWTTDRPATVDPGRLLRQKIVEEINRVVRQYRSAPNLTLYDFRGLGYPEGYPHKAYSAGAQNELAPGASGWTELRQDTQVQEYEKIWYSDDSRYSKSTLVNGEYALMLFRFKIESHKKTVRKIVLAFEGYGLSPSGSGVTVKVWNHVVQQWQHAQSGAGGEDETVTITLTENIVDFIDEDGYCWLLARTTYPSDGSTAATIYCDYCSCTVTVNGLTYLDVYAFRDADNVEVKPFIYRTEFTLRGWMFETVLGG
ncbi:MAG: hypothetical protein QXT10_05215 [Candidatus Bathyarchaeia archaeon]